jgi:hypothetical protein
LHRVEHRQHDLARGKNLNFQLVVGDLPNALGEDFARTIQGISDFGELAVSRHLISGIDCAMAGLAIEMALAPVTALRNWRRFIVILRC